MFAHRRLFFAVAALLVTPFVIGAFLSKEWEAVGRVEVKLDSQAVFAWLESAENWHVWNQVAEEAPIEFQVEAVGPPRGIGSQVNWSHEKYGQGALTVVEIDPGRRVRVQITPAGGAPIYSEVIFESQASPPAISRRDWSSFSGMGPLDGYVAWIASQAGKARVQRSLASLEEQVQKTAKTKSATEPGSADK